MTARVLQLSHKRLTDGEFRQVCNSERNFWWSWLHGQQRSQAQQKAAEAAFARAQPAAEVPGMNTFDVLATASDEVQTLYTLHTLSYKEFVTVSHQHHMSAVQSL